MIKKEKGKYVVRSESGNKKLGTHNSRQQAAKQLYAIHKSKEKRNG